MKILSRYILREVFTYFAITLFIFTGILFTLRVLKLTSLIINKGVSLSQVGTVFLAVIPAFLEIAIPLAALLGPMLTFARLSGDSEVIVIRASGISLARLVQPILLFGAFTALLCLGVSHYLKPWGFRTLSTTLFEIARTKSTAGLEPGIFNELGQIVLYAEEIDQATGKLKNVLVDDRRRDEQSRIIVAAEGEIQTNTSERSIVFHLTDGQIHEENDGKYIVTHYVTNDITLDANKLNGEEEVTAERRARELSWNELQEQQAALLHSLRRESELSSPTLTPPLVSSPDKQPLPTVPLVEESEQPKTAAELRVEAKEKLLKIQFEIHNRFSLPIAALLLALIGMPLGIQSPRSQKTWGPGLSAVIGLGAFLTYFAVFTIAKTFAEDGKLPALVAAWIPNLLTLAVALYFLRQMSSERWQTVSEGFERIFHQVKTLFATSTRHEQAAL